MFWYDCLRKGRELRRPNAARLPQKQLAARRYQIYVMACITQRVWRIATYVAGTVFVLTSDISDFALLIVLALGLMMDAFDSKGQYGTFLSLRKAMGGELKPASSRDELLAKRDEPKESHLTMTMLKHAEPAGAHSITHDTTRTASPVVRMLCSMLTERFLKSIRKVVY